MNNKLWFNQAGESYNGIPCNDIYGGCPVSQGGTPIVDTNPPVPLAIPAPNATDAEIANDPGYLQVLADGSVVDANGNLVSQGTDDGLVLAQPMLQAGQRVAIGIQSGTVSGIIQKTLPAKYEIIWDTGNTGFFLADEVTPIPNQPVQPITEPIYSIGQEIVYDSYLNCPVGGQISSNDPCIVSGRGVIVGMDETSPVPRYQVQMSTSNALAAEGDIKFLTEGEIRPFQPLGDGTPSPVVVEPPLVANSCGKDKYTLPIQIGEEKCIDKTLALVLGALAIYYIMTKK